MTPCDINCFVVAENASGFSNKHKIKNTFFCYILVNTCEPFKLLIISFPFLRLLLYACEMCWPGRVVWLLSVSYGLCYKMSRCSLMSRSNAKFIYLWVCSWTRALIEILETSIKLVLLNCTMTTSTKTITEKLCAACCSVWFDCWTISNEMLGK